MNLSDWSSASVSGVMMSESSKVCDVEKNSWCIQGPYIQYDTIKILLFNGPHYKYTTAIHFSTFVPVNPDLSFNLAVVKKLCNNKMEEQCLSTLDYQSVLWSGNS